MINEKSGCKEMFTAFIKKDFVNWKPWEADCVSSQLDDLFLRRTDSVNGFAGEDHIPAFFTYYKSENYINDVRIWKRNNVFLKLETEFPDINFSWPDQIKPDAGAAKLDYSFGGMIIHEGEWVYPEKGIAFFFNGDGNRIIKITIFLPTGLDKYKKEIRTSASVREFKD